MSIERFGNWKNGRVQVSSGLNILQVYKLVLILFLTIYRYFTANFHYEMI